MTGANGKLTAVAIDAVGIRSGGGQSVLLGLIDAMCVEQRIGQVVVFASTGHRREFAFASHPKLRVTEVGWADRSYVHRVLWSVWGLARACREAGVSSVLCTTGTGVGGKTPHICYIQQSLPFEAGYAAELPPLGKLWVRATRGLMARSCRRSKRVVVQTAHMARVVAKAFAIASERVVVAPPQVQMVASDSSCLEGPDALLGGGGCRPLLLYVGSAAKHKNVSLLLQSIDEIRAHFPVAAIALTCLRPAEYPERKGLVWLGPMARNAVSDLMRKVDALVIPSLYESGCIPLHEAMASGLPVLVADRPYAREICADAALYFDPTQREALVDCCVDLLTSAELKESLREAGKRRSRELENIGGYRITAREVLRGAGVV